MFFNNDEEKMFVHVCWTRGEHALIEHEQHLTLLTSLAPSGTPVRRSVPVELSSHWERGVLI